MTKSKKNIETLDEIFNKDNIDDNLNLPALNENKNKKRGRPKGGSGRDFTKIDLRLPKLFHALIKASIADYTVTGSVNSYVVEAVRQRLKNDNILK